MSQNSNQNVHGASKAPLPVSSSMEQSQDTSSNPKKEENETASLMDSEREDFDPEEGSINSEDHTSSCPRPESISKGKI